MRFKTPNSFKKSIKFQLRCKSAQPRTGTVGGLCCDTPKWDGGSKLQPSSQAASDFEQRVTGKPLAVKPTLGVILLLLLRCKKFHLFTL